MRIVILVGLIFSLISCKSENITDSEDVTLKDLGEIMIDLKAYHQNIGDNVRRGKLSESEWLVEGMDSTLQLAIVKFVDHPKLSGSFESFYKELLATPILDLKLSIKKNDQESAIENFILLTNNCNNCHKKHKVDKRAKFNP